MKMPLQKLSISRFRGATKPLEIEFDGKSVIMVFGENGTGKSTIVDAIDYVCNGRAGRLSERQATPIKEYLPSLGAQTSDVSINIQWAGAKWEAGLAGAKPQIKGKGIPPQAKILRRFQILNIVDVQPAERYKELSRFVDVSGVEKSEAGLRKAVQEVQDDYDTASRSYGEAISSLKDLQREDGAAAVDFKAWVKAKTETDSKILETSLERIENLKARLRSAAIASSDVARARDRLAADSASVQDLSVDLNAAEEANNQTDRNLLTLLESAEQYLQQHPDGDRCPVCEQSVDVKTLQASLAARRLSGAAITLASSKVAQALQRELLSGSHVQNEQRRFIRSATELAKGFSNAAISAVTSQEIDWSGYSLLLEDVPEDKLEQAFSLAEVMLPECEKCKVALDSEQESISKKVRSLQAIQLQFKSAARHLKQAKTQKALLERLQAILSLVESERKAFVDETLDSITDRVDALYGRLHPGEHLGNIRFHLDPKLKGSLHLMSRFESASEVPPQAYYSEAHLDTLGICVFIALAERDQDTDTLLVLDDVLTSADQAHIDRFIEMVHEELAIPVLITTHYRPWRDRYRYQSAPAGKVQLIDLLPWSQQRGIRHTKTKLEVEDLKGMLAQEPIDRQSLASKAGVLLEASLRHLCILYECRLPLKASGNHTLGEYLSGLDSKLRKLMKGVTTLQGKVPDQQIETVVEIKPLLDALDSTTWIRNLVGAHFNLSGMDVTDGQVAQFATAAMALLEALVCSECGELPRKNQGSFFTCGCKQRPLQLHPLTSPGA